MQAQRSCSGVRVRCRVLRRRAQFAPGAAPGTGPTRRGPQP